MANSLGDKSIDKMMTEILQSLEIIRRQLPNGEIKAIQDRIERIDESQQETKNELKAIKKQLLDPEIGLVVRVNRNTEYRQWHEEETKQEEKDHDKLVLEHSELMMFKKNVNRVIWVIFTTIAGLVAAMLINQFGG